METAKGKNDHQTGKNCVAFAILLILIIAVYSTSFKGTWQYDDFVNIVDNKNIQIKNLSPDALSKTFYKPSQTSGKYKKVQRPFAYFSFALNYYMGQYNPFGYHLVNLMIHYMAAVFLFLFLKKTILISGIQARPYINAYWVALASSAFWAIHPINVTAVTYIVQRMASMAGMFYILALYLYAMARTCEHRIKSIFYYSLLGIFSALAFCVKENTAMLPLTLFFYEILIIRGIENVNVKKIITLGAVSCAIVGGICLLYVNPASLFNGFDNRPFTPFERVLTESRVIWYYISLLIYPLPSRLTLLHDFTISTSIITPITTLLSIVAIIIIVIRSIFIVSKKQPFVGFCIVFFLLNHAIEGSFVPLELIYEHRNYVPSMLFWPPVVLLFFKVIDYFAYQRKMQLAFVLTAAFLMMANGHTTFAYNRKFESSIVLWSDNVKKMPGLSIVHNNLGDQFWKAGLGEKAFDAFKKALERDNYVNLAQKGIVHYNLGMYYLEWETNVTDALVHLNKAMGIAPGYKEIWIELSKAHMLDGDTQKAFLLLTKATALWPDDYEIRNNYAIVLLKNKNLSSAFDQAQKARKLNKSAPASMAVMAEILRQQERYDQSMDLWEQYMNKMPFDIRGSLALLELYSKAQRFDKIEENMGRILYLKQGNSFKEMIETASAQPETRAYVPDADRLLSIISTILNRLKIEADKIDDP